MVLSDLCISNFPIWVQLWGVPLEYHTLDFVEYLGSIIGPVEWIDWPTGNLRNLRFLRLKVRIRTHAPHFMGFLLRLDDNNCSWIQCKYERVFRFCFSCGQIGHKADTCIHSHDQVRSAVQEQLMRARSVFNLNIAVDYLEDHFVSRARAFENHPSKRTTQVDLIFEEDAFHYRPYDVRRTTVNEDPNLFPMAPPSPIFNDSNPSKEDLNL